MYSAGWFSAGSGLFVKFVPLRPAWRTQQIVKIVLSYQSQPLQQTGVFCAGGDQVDAGGFDTAVAQHVGQFRHVPADLVECPCEQ